jgi:hypothetical protein
MDIEEFYERDERRRASAELELGTEWLDDKGMRFELSWVEDTGELYVMREPAPPGWTDPFGGIHTEVDGAPVGGMDVTVLGTIPSRADLDGLLDGWVDQVGKDDSVHWLIERLDHGGVLSPSAKDQAPD